VINVHDFGDASMKYVIVLILNITVLSALTVAQNNLPAELRERQRRATTPAAYRISGREHARRRGITSTQQRAEEERRALIDLENSWLKSEHDSDALERILASDFVHPVPTGDFLTKEQHIFYSTKHLPPANLHKHFEDLKVRVYGTVGMVNGMVVTTTGENEKVVNRTVFTDVFVNRDGRWQAINAQENKVEKPER
jgi:hypothetical protein